MIKTPKFCIGPMSKEVVDTVIDYYNDTGRAIWFIPSRRQVEWDGGYVNNWTTYGFCSYVRKRSKNNLIMRDHGGPHQGAVIDIGYSSISADAMMMDGIHVDPWKKYREIEDAANCTSEIIRFCSRTNGNLFFEIGTEQGIREMSVDEMERFILLVRDKLKGTFDRVEYFVIQSGTGLKENHNTGKYDTSKLADMTSLCKKYGLKSKEHNGDYLSSDAVSARFDGGLDTINIAPEFGYIQTKLILSEIKGNEELFEKMFDVCLSSKKWCKWVGEDFNPNDRKEELIKICGHYVFSDQEIVKITRSIDNFEDKVKTVLRARLDELYSGV